ncbi:MAG: nickel pincer cofactor biosynthesis protein LarC [Actinomycetes bacterium]
MTRVAWWHCLAGASGDMCLGALVDAGVPLETIQSAIDAVGVEPVVVTREAVTRQGVTATRIEVSTQTSTVIRTWGNIRSLLEEAPLPEPVRKLALDVFARLARAEAAAHRTEPDQVRFHEVGALDAIADVVGTAAGMHALGIETVVASPIALGYGMTRGEHGLLPVPGPAVLALLEEVGAPVYSGGVTAELCTPTGAALLAAMVGDWGELPPLRIDAVGNGAGSRELDELPNVLRLVVGTAVEDADPTTGPAADTAIVVEANVDDLDPRIWPTVLTQILEAGADDAWLTPIVMKKGRPAHTLSVLCSDIAAEEVRRVIFTETSTIGLREHRVGKRALERTMTTVHVDGARIRVKIAVLDDNIVNALPEYDDIAAAAVQLGRPVKAILAAATAAAHEAGVAAGAPGQPV